MESKFSYFLKGTLFCVVGILIMMWGMSDLVILFDAPKSLIFIIPAIIAVIVLVIMVIIIIRVTKKEAIFSNKTKHYCAECGSPIRLEEKVCSKCGAENVKRKEALELLEEREKSIATTKAKILEKSQSKKYRTPRNRKFDERQIELLNSQAKRIKLKKTDLIVGTALEDKIKWAKTQYHEKNRSIQDIANELGVSMINVRAYIDSNSQNEKSDII